MTAHPLHPTHMPGGFTVCELAWEGRRPISKTKGLKLRLEESAARCTDVGGHRPPAANPDERVTGGCVTPASATLSDAAGAPLRLLHERDARHAVIGTIIAAVVAVPGARCGFRRSEVMTRRCRGRGLIDDPGAHCSIGIGVASDLRMRSFGPRSALRGRRASRASRANHRRSTNTGSSARSHTPDKVTVSLCVHDSHVGHRHASDDEPCTTLPGAAHGRPRVDQRPRR